MTNPTSTPIAPETAPKSGRDLPAAIGVAAVLITAIVLTLAFFPLGFVILAGLMMAIGAWELSGAVAAKGAHAQTWPIVVGTLIATIAPYCVAKAVPGTAWVGVLLGTLGLLVLLCLTLHMLHGHDGFVKDASASLFIIAYVPLLGSFVNLMMMAPDGVARVATFLACVVMSDTGGYFVGSKLGRHKLAPHISPKKSWEGLAGSAVFSMLAGVVGVTVGLHASWWIGLVLGLVLMICGTAGDLIESALKRDVGLKDMSNLLPGHGGFMDRLDSMLGAVPAAWLVLFLLVPVA